MATVTIVRWVLAAAILATGIFLICREASAAEYGAPVDLAAAVSDLAGRQVQIRIETELPGSWGGGAYPGMPVIFIGRTAYDDAEAGGGHGLMVLLHELGHTTGIHDEGEANCFALVHIVAFVDRYWQPADVWMHVESRAYDAAYRSMRAQSAVYQCGRAA